jgi:hypothetical protein
MCARAQQEVSIARHGMDVRLLDPIIVNETHSTLSSAEPIFLVGVFGA